MALIDGFKAREKQIVEAFQSTLLEVNKVATGGTRDSIRAEFVPKGKYEVEVLVYAKKAFDQALEGRGSGLPPPIIKIVEYIAAKRLSLNPFAVRENIAARGTNPASKVELKTYFGLVNKKLSPIIQAAGSSQTGVIEEILKGLRDAYRNNLKP